MRLLPALPPPRERLPLLIDSDVANEIDDLYAIGLALAAPHRFDLKGFVATHFSGKAGPESTGKSYDLLLRFLQASGHDKQLAASRGGHPMQYPETPVPSAGTELIIDRALRATEANPLWIVVLGAATNTASALLLAPEIMPRVRVVFHARCSRLWPERTAQFNVFGDVIAAQTLLSCGVPLVWFDTGTGLAVAYEETRRRLAPIGATGRFLHDYRDLEHGFADSQKGFYDLGDIAWMIDPTLCAVSTVPAPTLERTLEFNHNHTHGFMLRTTGIDVERTWELFFRTLEQAWKAGVIA